MGEAALGELTLRSASAQDEAAIRRMVRQARLDPTQLRWENFLVAEQAGQLVAVGQLRRYGAVQELGSLVVQPGRQGEGIGGALVRTLVARREGELFLECDHKLAPYYARYGFVPLPWHAVPWPLRAKFALTTLLSRLFGARIAVMTFRNSAAESL